MLVHTVKQSSVYMMEIKVGDGPFVSTCVIFDYSFLYIKIMNRRLIKDELTVAKSVYRGSL